jgi:hypothetical protein
VLPVTGCWDYVGTMLGLCWDYVGTMLGLCWDYVGYRVLHSLPSPQSNQPGQPMQ